MSTQYKVRDKRRREYFTIDNEYLNGLGKYMGLGAIGVYVSLCRHADNEQKCFPAQATIANELGVSEATVKRYLRVLRKHNVIDVQRVKKGRKWAHNVYYLLDKSEWVYPKEVQGSNMTCDVQGSNSEVSGVTGEPYQGSHRPTNNTNRTRLINKTNIAGTSPAVISNIIELFSEFNPACKNYYRNKTQRKAVSDLVKNYGEEQVIKVVKILPKVNTLSYVPTVTTPYQLEQKWTSLSSSLIKLKNTKKQLIDLDNI